MPIASLLGAPKWSRRESTVSRGDRRIVSGPGRSAQSVKRDRLAPETHSLAEAQTNPLDIATGRG